MFNVIPFRAARNLMNTSMDDMLSDRFFRHFFDMSDMVGTAGFRVDVKEQPDAYVLEAELPGVKQDDITLTAEDGVLTIAADINSEKKDNREGYLYSERRTGHVERRFSLEGVREDDITAKCEHGIPVPVKKDRPYSMDRNIWHISHEGADLEDPWNEPPEDLLLTMVTPEKAPDQPEYVTVDFEKGVPVAINGEKLDAVDLLTKANEIAGRNGVGCADLVENRLVGMKSRGVYETPGGTMLYAAHGILESITLDRATSHYKELVASKFAELVYDGMWYTPLREALSAFVDSTQQAVNGTVKLKLYKGNCINAGVKSPNSLYMEEIATFGDSHDLYSHKDSAGFINLLGLPLKVKAMVEQKNKK